jgi:trimeric autotransporter adhesin
LSATVRSVLVTANYAAAYGDVVLVDATAGPVTVTLPPASLGLAEIIVKKTDASPNAVTVNRSGAALIDGSMSHALSAQYALIRLLADGTNWQVTGGVTASASAPGPPTIGSATAGNAAADVTFSAPTSNGGSPITSYTATSSPGSHTGTGTTSPVTVTGLTNGTAYTFTVHATNGVGPGPESASSNTVTPSSAPVAPGAPTIGTAVADSGTQATANWTAPASDGGSAVTGYVVKTYKASDNSLLFTDTLGVVVTFARTGLTTGTAVYFKVAAINAVNTGAQSAASNTVTPSVPGASDNFNRADENPLGTSSGGQPYIQPNLGKFKVSGNKALVTGLGTGPAFSLLETSLADFTLTADLNVVAGGEMYAVFRYIDTDNYWIAGVFNGYCILTRHLAGVNSAPGGFPGSGQASGAYGLKVVCAGASIKVYVDIGAGYVTKHDITDSALATATKAGLATGFSVADTDSSVDNFLVVP